MSKSKEAASAAMAEPCPPKSIAVPVDIVDTIVDIVDRAETVIREYCGAIENANILNGAWIGGEDEAMQLSSAVAASNGLRQVGWEFGLADEVPFAGSEALPQHVPGSLRFRSKPIADPEADARAEYARQDAARGEAGRKRAFEVDPMSAAFRSPALGASEEEWGEFYARRSAAYLGVPYEVVGTAMGKRMTREKFVKSIWYQMFIDKIADEAAYYRSKGWLSDEASS